MKFLIEQFFVIVAVMGLLFAILFAAKSFHVDQHRKRNGYQVRHGKLFAVFMAFAVIVIMLAVLPCANAQVSSTYIAVTNQPAVVTTTATSNIVSWVKCNSQSDITLSWRFNQSGNSTSNATLNVYTSIDGTNISTVPFAQLTAASTGTTDVIVNTNIPRSAIGMYDSLIIGNIANTTALTTLTNKAITVKRGPF